MSLTRNVVFSTTWNWGSYENNPLNNFGKVKQFNFSDTPYIISNNFSPFAGELLDTYLMVSFNYKDFNGVEYDNMKIRRKIKNIGFYLLAKTNFEEPLDILCELWPHRENQTKTVENYSNKLVISK